MDELIYFKISDIDDDFFKKFLFIFYDNAEELAIPKKNLEEKFIIYQKAIIFLSLVNRKMNYKKIDFWKELNTSKHNDIDKLDYLTEDSNSLIDDREIEIFIENHFSPQDALFLKVIFIEDVPLKEVAIKINVSPQAVSKRKKKLEKQLKNKLEEVIYG